MDMTTGASFEPVLEGTSSSRRQKYRPQPKSVHAEQLHRIISKDARWKGVFTDTTEVQFRAVKYGIVTWLGFAPGQGREARRPAEEPRLCSRTRRSWVVSVSNHGLRGTEKRARGVAAFSMEAWILCNKKHQPLHAANKTAREHLRK
jgi:hypothetical protein